MNIETGQVTNVDNGKFMYEGGLRNFTADWSPDSRWLTYARENTRVASAIFVYDTQINQRHQLTSGYYNDGQPVFSKDGKYLFYTTNRNFQPIYSDLDNTFIYPNTTGIAVATLLKDTESLLSVKNDALSMEEKKDESAETKPDKKSKKGTNPFVLLTKRKR